MPPYSTPKPANQKTWKHLIGIWVGGSSMFLIKIGFELMTSLLRCPVHIFEK